MGLDMYLYKKHYVGNKWRKPEQQVRVIVPKDQKGVTFPVDSIKPERIDEITENVAYWRKANHIHRWFVENVQNDTDDCKAYYVSSEQLTELRDICREVIKASKLVKGKITNGYTYENGEWKPILEDGKYIEDASKARELLPTQIGFFFGSEEYDQYYLDDVKYTEKILTDLLAEPSRADFYYQSSW
jgi:hypothetical protein